jgi:hypothetical protein
MHSLMTLLHRHGLQLTARHVPAGPYMLAPVTLTGLEEA